MAIALAKGSTALPERGVGRTPNWSFWMMFALRGRPALLVFAALVSAFAVSAVAEDAGKPVGDALYSSSFKDLKDQPTKMDRFKGKVLVMYFWATWCVPCRAETPNLIKLNDQYKDKGVTFIGVALDKGDKVRDFVKEMNVTYPIFYGGPEVVKLGRALGNDSGAIPFTVVIGKDGKLVHAFKGDMENAELEKIINPLLG